MSSYPTLEHWARERAELAAAVAPRACAIHIERGRAISGFAWRGGLVVTAAEGVAGASRLRVHTDEGEGSAELVALDLATDVAVLRSEHVASDTTPRVTDAARAGAPVFVSGRRGADVIARWTSLQLVGAGWRSRRGGAIAQRLELGDRLESALEGAAVWSTDGALIAMSVPGPHRGTIGIPARNVERVLEAVEKHGYLPRPYLGLRLQTLWLDEAARARLGREEQRIALVAGVQQGSPAAEAGVELGDLLMGVGGRAVPDAAALARYLAEVSPGDALSLEVRRGGESRVLAVRVGESRAA
jgi:S1-C subfamily serine protease